MTIESGGVRSPLPGMLAARESMQPFFQNWLESDRLQVVWDTHKKIATDKVVAFLTGRSAILAAITETGRENWVEQSIERLEDLEKIQLGQRFLTANASWDSDKKRQIIHLPTLEELPANNTPVSSCGLESIGLSPSEAMIFMPEVSRGESPHLDVTDVLRQGLTAARAFLDIIYLSEVVIADEIGYLLECQLQTFRQQIKLTWQLQIGKDRQRQKSQRKAMKDAARAYVMFLDQLAQTLVQAGIYKKIYDARCGISYMLGFLSSENHEKSVICVQHSAKDQANILVFEPKSVQGSGSVEALWVKKLAEKHPWVKKLPWQVLQRPQPAMNWNGEGLKVKKTTLVLVKKTTSAVTVDCTPVGELSGIPVPIAMNNLAERYRITLANQKGVFLGSQTHDDKPPFNKLEETITHQLEMLRSLLTKERCRKGVSIPLADINLVQRILPYKSAGAGWLQDRADANEEIRQLLSQYVVYYDALNAKCIWLDKTQTDFAVTRQQLATNEQFIPIHVEFHDPSIVYNNLRAFSYRTNEDADGLKAGIRVAVERLEILLEKLMELDDLRIYQQDIHAIKKIQTFLQTRAVGLYLPQGIPSDVITAAHDLSEKLRMAYYPFESDADDNRKVQIEMLKILQASLIVKDESFESIFGYLRRIINSDFIGALLIYPENKCFRRFLSAKTISDKIVWTMSGILVAPLFILGWLARLSLTLCAAIIKIPFGIYAGVQSLLGVGQNRSKRLAAAAGILFGAMGRKKLNCKSGADRGLSVLLLVYAMINRAINGEKLAGKVPLMLESGERTFAEDRVGATINHRQLLKAIRLVNSL